MQTEKKQGRPVIYPTKEAWNEHRRKREVGHMKLRFYDNLEARDLIKERASELGYPSLQEFLMAAALGYRRKYKKPTSK